MRKNYFLSVGGLTVISSLGLSLLFLYSFFGWSVEFGIALILAVTSLLWESLGYVFLAFVGLLLVYHRVGGVFGLTTLVFSLCAVESLYLSKRNAPLEHYYVLFGGTFLSIPLYYFAYVLSFYTPSFVNTAVAALFVVLLYILIYIVIKR
ncbi:hypothetical protein [Thermococcus sp.]